jgi:ABC-type antimicrobial peptide transport system permease subunit
MFLREAILLVGLGVALGLPLALAVANPLQAFLYNVSATDPIAITITLLVIALGSLAASFLPALRATRVDPTEALRCD